MDWLSSRSYWHATSEVPAAYPRLEQDVQADVAVIGGGITGLTAAMHLKKAGRRVVLLEAGRIGAGTTGGTSGHLEALPDQGLDRLIRDHGKETARLVTQARLDAIDHIEGWCSEYGIDCDFARVPAYLYSESADGARNLMEQCSAARELGLRAEPVQTIDLPFPCAGGLRFERQARFHSLRYLRGLVERLHGDDCTVYENTRAQPPADGQPCIVEAAGGRVTCRDVLLCTHSCFLGISEIDLRVAPYQSYVIVVSIPQEFPDALFWDDGSPYNYLRRASSSDPQTVIIGGADHKTGHGGERQAYQWLEGYARKRFDVREIRQRWSAEFFESADGLPYVGTVPFAKHIHVSTGFSGTGLTFGTVAGRLLAEGLLQQAGPLGQALSPSRFKPKAAVGKLLSENFDAAKRFVMDRLGPHSIESLNEIAIGTGRLVRYKGHALAAYRDENGLVHLLSPVCTHAGCYVQWNEAEKTWDCPCHGGRYSAVGERLYGPPSHDLKQKPQQEL